MPRLIILCLLTFLAWAPGALAGTGRIIKVLPQFLDQKGRHSLSPSLYDRDAYQAILRKDPNKRSGMRYCIQWKAKQPIYETLTLRLELRGIAEGRLPRQMSMERAVTTTGWLGKWTVLTLSGDDYMRFGQVTAWRVTLWEGSQLLSEQKSFLW